MEDSKDSVRKSGSGEISKDEMNTCRVWQRYIKSEVELEVVVEWLEWPVVVYLGCLKCIVYHFAGEVTTIWTTSDDLAPIGSVRALLGQDWLSASGIGS